ncbi:hypothetical protein FHG87_001060 [Trinorchestia longiramus]|nr:hypothetical protein FHG87_001060 [Trinorchestia longiramus]
MKSRASELGCSFERRRGKKFLLGVPVVRRRRKRRRRRRRRRRRNKKKGSRRRRSRGTISSLICAHTSSCM